jgi:hypothetical protein
MDSQHMLPFSHPFDSFTSRFEQVICIHIAIHKETIYYRASGHTDIPGTFAQDVNGRMFQSMISTHPSYGTQKQKWT